MNTAARRAGRGLGTAATILKYMAVSRRVFITASGVALSALTGLAAGSQGLEQFAVAEAPCTDDPRVTPAVPRDTTFKSGAPLRRSLVEAGMKGQPLVFSGTVTGVSCGRVAGARVDLWQADAAGVYDMVGFRLRGHQRTDASGAFEFRTIVPGRPARRAPHLGIRIQVDGKIDYATELFFPNDAANAADPRFASVLVLTMQNAGAERRATFAIVLPI